MYGQIHAGENIFSFVHVFSVTFDTERPKNNKISISIVANNLLVMSSNLTVFMTNILNVVLL